MELTISFEDLRVIDFVDFGIDQNNIELKLNYLPMELINTIDCPPITEEASGPAYRRAGSGKNG